MQQQPSRSQSRERDYMYKYYILEWHCCILSYPYFGNGSIQMILCAGIASNAAKMIPRESPIGTMPRANVWCVIGTSFEMR